MPRSQVSDWFEEKARTLQLQVVGRMLGMQPQPLFTPRQGGFPSTSTGPNRNLDVGRESWELA